MADATAWQPPEANQWQPPEVGMDAPAQTTSDLAPLFRKGVGGVLDAMQPDTQAQMKTFLAAVPEDLKKAKTAQTANLMLLANVPGAPDASDIKRNQSVYENSFARQMGWADESTPQLDHEAFFNAAQQHFAKQDALNARIADMGHTMLTETMAGGNAVGAGRAFIKAQMAKPDFDPADLKPMNDAVEKTRVAQAAMVQKYGPQVQAVANAYLHNLTSDGSQTDAVNAAVEAMRPLSDADRRMVAGLAALHVANVMAPAADGSDKEDPNELGWFGRGGETINRSILRTADAVGAAAMPANMPSMTGMPQTAADAAGAKAAHDTYAIRLMLRDAYDSTADPVQAKNLAEKVFQGVVGSVPNIAMVAASPPVAAGLLLAASHEERVAQGQPETEAAVGATTDMLQNFIGGHLIFKGAYAGMEQAGVQTLRQIGVNAAKRAAGDAVVFGAANVAGQALPGIVQNLADSLDGVKTPGQPSYSDIWDKLKEHKAETVASIAVMTLLATGAGALRDSDKLAAFTQDKNAWAGTGLFTQAEAKQIAALPTVDARVAKANELARPAMEAKQRAAAKEAQAQALADLDAAVQAGRQPGQPDATGLPGQPIEDAGQANTAPAPENAPNGQETPQTSAAQKRQEAVPMVQAEIEKAKSDRQSGITVEPVTGDDLDGLKYGDGELYRVQSPNSETSYNVAKNGEKWSVESDQGSGRGDYATKEQAIEAAKQEVAAETGDDKGAFGISTDASHAVEGIFQHFDLPEGVTENGWFRTKWGSWYNEITLPDGTTWKLSVRDHQQGNGPAGRANITYEVGKDWSPTDVAKALDHIEKKVKEGAESHAAKSDDSPPPRSTISLPTTPGAPVAVRDGETGEVVAHAATPLDATTEAARHDAAKANLPPAGVILDAQGRPEPTTEAPVAENAPTEAKSATVEPDVTGISIEAINKELVARGMAPMTDAEVISNETHLKAAKDAVAADPGLPQKLVEEIEAAKAKGGTRPLDATETMILDLEARKYANERTALAGQRSEIEAMPNSPEKAARLEDVAQREAVAQDAFERFKDANRQAGTDVARAQQIRGRLLRDDYTLAPLTARVKEAQGGKELAPEQAKAVADISSQLADVQAQLKEAHDNLARAKARGAEMPERGSGPKRSAPVNRVAKFLSEQADAARARIAERVKAAEAGQRLGAGLDPQEIIDHAAIVADYMAKGVTKAAEITQKLVDEFGERVRDAIPAIIAKAQELRDTAAINARLAQLDALIEKTEKQIETGDVLPKAKGEPPTSPEITAREEKLAELRKEKAQLRDELTPPEEKNAKALDAYKERLRARVEKLTAANDAMERGEEPPPKRSRTAKAMMQLDDEAKALQTKEQGLKDRGEQLVAEAAEAKKPGWQKVMDQAAGAAHASALLGYHVLAKITASNALRFIETPLQEYSAYLLNRLGVTPDATMEGGKPEMGRYYATIATRGLEAAKEQLFTGTTAERTLAGKGEKRVVHWWDYPGANGHGAMSTPEWTGKYEMYLAKRMTSAKAAGVDVEDEMVKGALRKEAADYADRSIMREDNAAAKMVNDWLGWFKKTDKDTGQPNMARYALGTAIEAEVTKNIVKLPMNHAWQTVEDGPLGLGIGILKRGAVALRTNGGGVKMTPAEANIISRLISRGLMGSAFFAWAAMDALRPDKDRTFGGFYEPRDHRGKDDVPMGQMRIAGMNIPKWACVLPIVLQAQLGSTFMRVAMSKLHKTDREDAGMRAAALTSVLTLVQQAPVASSLPHLANLGDAHTMDNEFGKILSGNVPAVVREIAEDTDPAKKRVTKGIGDNLKAVIPGLRETLPKGK